MKKVCIIFNKYEYTGMAPEETIHKIFSSKPLADKYLMDIGLEALEYTEPMEFNIER